MNRKLLSIVVGSLLYSSTAYADISFNGFLSAGAGQIIDDDEMSEYSGYDDKFNTKPDTTLGLQVQSEVADKVTAVGQFIARGSNDFDVEAEWAYVSYEATDELSTRIGRLRTPYFLYSDFLDVGYAYPWIRPPIQTYRDSLFTSIQGVDAIYKHTLGDWDGTVQLLYGRYNENLEDDTGQTVGVDVESSIGANWVLTKDFLTLRASYVQSRFSVDNATLTSFKSAYDDIGESEAGDALLIQGESAGFAGLGAIVDLDEWLFIAEYTSVFMDQQAAGVSDEDSYFFTLGKRFGNKMLHLTYNVTETDPDYTYASAIDPTATFTSGPATGANARGTAFATTGDKEKYTDITLGMRFDVAASTAFKLELTQFNKEVEANANYGQAGSDLSGTLLSAAVDVVF